MAPFAAGWCDCSGVDDEFVDGIGLGEDRLDVVPVFGDDGVVGA